MRAAASGRTCTPWRCKGSGTKIFPFKWEKRKKKNPPEKLNSACFQLPVEKKRERKGARTNTHALSWTSLFTRALLARTDEFSPLWLHLPTCSSCRTHVGGPTSTDFVLRVSDLRPACCLGSFSPIHPPLIIPACPPITASASTSHSHTVPQAALIPSSQLQNLELSEEGGFFMPETPERARVVTEEYGRFFLGVMTVWKWLTHAQGKCDSLLSLRKIKEEN